MAARLGDRHFVLNETGARKHDWHGVGALSIKAFAGGRAHYDTGAGRHSVDEDCYLVLNEGQPYSISLEAERPMDSFCVFFRDGFAGEVKRAIESTTGQLLDDPAGRPGPAPRFFERSYPHDDVVTPELRRLRRACAGLPVPGTLEEGLHALMESLLLRHRAAVRESESLKALRAGTRDELYRRLHRARDYALASLQEPLTLDALAGAACLSPSHFLRSFRELFGLTPHQFLIERRLERAAALLQRTEQPVTDVSLSVGFSSLGSFSWLFRRRMGVSPSNTERAPGKAISEKPGRPSPAEDPAGVRSGAKEEESMPTADGLSVIGQISVVVKDLDRARAFYKDVLGMKHLFDAPPQLAFFDCSGVRLMLSPAEKPEFERPSSILYFRVKDTRETHRAFVARGVRFEREPHMLAKMPAYELWMAFFRDSEDNLLALMSELPIQG